MTHERHEHIPKVAPAETDFTLQFVGPNLPDDCKTILEIGAGGGDLAAALNKRGYRVLALDADEASVQRAKGLGVDAIKGQWPCKLDRPFDAVLFTRSLHHISPLDEAVDAAARALNVQGRLIVEDFDTHGPEPRSAIWFSQWVRGLLKHDVIEPSDWLLKVADEQGVLDAWRHGHDHALHSAATIDAALRRRFAKVDASGAPYFFRYIARAMRQSFGSSSVELLLGIEERAIADGTIEPLGRRFVAAL